MSMGKIRRGIKKISQNPRAIVNYINSLGLLNGLSDKKHSQLLWWAKTGKKLNLSNPKGFNEKIQWLKIYDHNARYTQLVDKYLVRDFVKKTIGEKYLIPLLGVWDNSDQIDFSALPRAFVLKCNHNSGGAMCICKDKSELNIQSIKQNLNRELQKNYYYSNREWPYKNISPKILAEQFITDNDPQNTTQTLLNYKFYCFNGEPRFLYVGTDDISKGLKGKLRLSFFDLEWNTPPFYRKDHQPLPIHVKAPESLNEMIKIARILSNSIPFVRVDLYWVNHRILFSEMTFYPGAGYGFFSPEKWELQLGDWIKLPNDNT